MSSTRSESTPQHDAAMPAAYEHAHHHGCRPRHMSITSEGQLEKAANKLSADEVNTLHPP